MSIKLFVAGLPYGMTEIELLELFSNHVLVHELNIVKEGTRSLCYGFVQVQNQAFAQRAIDALNGKLIGNRKLVVRLATEKRSMINN